MLDALNMPRSFLVKKVKLDDFSSADLESAYGRSRSDLSLRIHEKGKRKPLKLAEVFLVRLSSLMLGAVIPALFIW